MLAFSSLKSGAYNKRASVITSDDTKALCSEYFIGKKTQVWVQVPLVLPNRGSVKNSASKYLPTQLMVVGIISSTEVWPQYPLFGVILVCVYICFSKFGYS